MKLDRQGSTAVFLLCALLSILVPLAAAQAAATPVRSSAAPVPASKEPQAKSKAEFDAYQAAISMTGAATLESAAIDFSQRYPASELRPYLFQRAMGLYQQADNAPKTLEMARSVLKYDPDNPLALLTAAQILAESTRDEDLDREERLQEAATDAQAALQHAGELMRPASFTHEQFAEAAAKLRADAHEVLATVAYKRRDYGQAISEYNAAIGLQNGAAEAAVWLRLAAAYDKLGDFASGIAAADKAIVASQPGTPVRELAEKEALRLKAMAGSAPSTAKAPPASVAGQ